MKKWSRLYFIALLSLLSVPAFSQDKWDFEWEHYNLIFTLAEDFKVTTNTADEFTASGDGMEFGVFPFNDETVDETSITSYTLDIAKSLEMERLDDVDILTLNGLKGAFVEGYKDGSRIVLLGFIDPESETNFFSVITFSDDDTEAEAETVRIIKSFRKK
jgi:hypothetical protein